MKPKDMRSKNRKLAERVAEELFRSGLGQIGTHLVLEADNGIDLGGWCLDDIIDRVQTVLDLAEAKPGPARRQNG